MGGRVDPLPDRGGGEPFRVGDPEIGRAERSEAWGYEGVESPRVIYPVLHLTISNKSALKILIFAFSWRG